VIIELVLQIKHEMTKKKDSFQSKVIAALQTCFSSVTNNLLSFKIGKSDCTISYRYAEHSSEGQTDKNKLCYLTLESNQKSDIAARYLDAAYELLLEKINNGLCKFTIITLYDERSRYYSIKAYPLFCEFETKLRCLILKILTKSFGVLWADKTLSDDIKAKVKAIIKGSDIQKLASEAIYAMDFQTLSDYLFIEYRTIKSDEIIDNYLERTKLATYDYEKICELIEMARAKSNWERYFSEEIPIHDLKEKISIIRDSRNSIAHNKKYIGKEYRSNKKLITDFCELFDSAIDTIEVKPVSTQNGLDSIWGLQLFILNSMSKANSIIKDMSSLTLKKKNEISALGSGLNLVFTNKPEITELMRAVSVPLQNDLSILPKWDFSAYIPDLGLLKGFKPSFDPALLVALGQIQDNAERLLPSKELIDRITLLPRIAVANNNKFIKLLFDVQNRSDIKSDNRKEEIETKDDDSSPTPPSVDPTPPATDV
jgi:hypothetical protein